MEQDALGLTTTILSSGGSGGCARGRRRVWDAVAVWWGRTCSWRTALLPRHATRYATRHNTSTRRRHDAARPPLPPQKIAFRMPHAIYARALGLQAHHDAHMKQQTGPVCRTAPLSLLDARELVHGLFDFDLRAAVTCGGMSRIFDTSSPGVLVKISNLSRGWSKFEPHGYELLRGAGVPTARILHAGFRKGFLIVAVERLDCTVSSLLRSIIDTDAMWLDELTAALHRLLRALRDANVTFCDLSPDNIMCRSEQQQQQQQTTGEQLALVGLELVLIDPQFALPTPALAKALGPVWAEAFDTVHLALKIQAIGIVNARRASALRTATDAVCAALLGRDDPPEERHTTRWLLHDVPLGLRVAFARLEALQAAADKNLATLHELEEEQEQDGGDGSHQEHQEHQDHQDHQEEHQEEHEDQETRHPR